MYIPSPRLAHLIHLVKSTISIWLQAQVFSTAAALAFYTLFSLAPVAIVVVTLVGFVFGEQAAHGEVVAQLETYLGADAAEVIQTAIENSTIKHSGLFPLLAGVGAMLFGATTVFAHLQTSLNAIWSVEPMPTRSGIVVYLTRRLLSLCVVFGIGAVLFVSMVLSIGLRAVLSWDSDWVPKQVLVLMSADWMLSVVVMTLLFAAIFKILPDVVVSWRDVFFGAFVTAVFFVVGRALIGFYLAQKAPGSTYGAAGSLVILLMWVYYSSLILFAGAAFTRAQLEERGETVRPRKNAVGIVRSTQVEENLTSAANTPS